MVNAITVVNAMTVERSSAARETLARLRGEVRRVESAGRPVGGSAIISSGVATIDRLLPQGGYPRGSLVEWLAPADGCGAELLGLLLAGQAATAGGAVVIADPRQDFYPPAAARLGLRLEQLIVVREQRGDDLYWAIEQSLRCSAVAAVYAAAPLGTTAGKNSFLGNLDELWLRRFQLAAEQSGVVGVFVRPIRVAGQPTWSDVQWRVAPPINRTALSSNLYPPSDGRTTDSSAHTFRTIRLQLLRCRGAAAVGQTIALEFDMLSGRLRRAPERASSTAAPMATRTANPEVIRTTKVIRTATQIGQNGRSGRRTGS